MTSRSRQNRRHSMDAGGTAGTDSLAEQALRHGMALLVKFGASPLVPGVRQRDAARRVRGWKR
jgi:hypothetical protein